MSDKYPGGFITAGAPAGFSVAFDGTGDYLSGVPSTAYDFGTSENYSVEFWAYLNSVPSSFAFTGGNATGAFGINYDTSGGYLKCGKGGVGNQLTTSYVLQSGQWYHIVFCRQSSTLSAFVNGTRVATTTDSTSYTATAGFIGGDTSFASMNGYLSNFRIVTGSSAYNPSSTTITVPTQLFPITNTALLACQSPTIIDTSGNAVTLTANGDAKVSNFTPFAAFSGSLVPRSSPQTASGIWTIDEAAYYTTQGLWPTAPDVPQKSLRFNSADSAYLSWTPPQAGNRKTWTWSGWIKKCDVGNVEQQLFGAQANACHLFFTNDSLYFHLADTGSSTASAILNTTQVFRDVSAWYHIVVAVDTTQATSSTRMKVYVNGTQVTAFGTATYPAQNYESAFNAVGQHSIGYRTSTQGTAGEAYGGYITEVNFVDGQALEPTAFGAFEGGTGVWSPAPYSGTYGTNGFYLRFLDNSNTTAATLGKDSSPNGNNWTPNNFSVTAGVGNDSMLDTPNRFGVDSGVGGQVGGSYCTLNPLDKGSDVNTVVNGNLDATWNSNNGHSIRSTMSVSSGKWYWEFTNVNNLSSGVIQQQLKIVPSSGSLWPGSDGFGVGGSFAYRPDTGQKVTNSVNSTYGATYTTTDVIGCALDMDNGKIWWSKNGTWQASGDPAAGTNEAYSGLSGNFSPAWGYINPGNNTVTANFGQRAFAYTAPTGFKALVSTNLATPAVGASNATLASKNFEATLYTGNSSTQNITTGFQPDFVWIKSRSTADVHTLQDVLRGSKYYLQSNSTATEATQADSDGISAFTSTGFTLGYTDSDAWNKSPNTYVSWNWKAGGTGVTNTSGTITSTVSANTTSGFSVVTYTGNGTSGATFGHGLGAVPAMIIFKCRDTAYQWLTYQVTLGNTSFLTLDSTAAVTTSRGDFLNSTTPSSSLVTLGNTAGINESTKTYVAYCFAEVVGFSKFNSYVGNGNSDGPFVYTGFRPRYVLIRNTSGGSWEQYDTSRNPYNQANLLLEPNSAGAEQTAAGYVLDIVSNGFKLRGTGSGINTSGNTFIYMAFAEAPFNYSRAR
jgi:hypothetical protein